VNLDGLLTRLAEREPAVTPFVSLYVNTQPDQTGHPRYDTFVRKELTARIESLPARSTDRETLERDAERIRDYLARELRPGVRAAALFACAGSAGFLEAVQLEVPVEEHQLFVSNRPYVHPLAWLNERYRRFACLVADSHTARLFVFEAGARMVERELTHPKVRRSGGGGRAQARYQHHLEHEQLRRAKAAIEALKRVVLDERIDRIVLAGDDVIVPVIREQLPKALAARVIAAVHLDIRAAEADILRAGTDAVREWDAQDDAERVARVLDAQRGSGRGVVGIRATRAALDRGQVEELLLTAPAKHLPVEAADAPQIAEGLVRTALTTDARLIFVENSRLLAEAEGVGGLLRYAA
jgi:peptide subunit release factor 1 (eRF1)